MVSRRLRDRADSQFVIRVRADENVVSRIVQRRNGTLQHLPVTACSRHSATKTPIRRSGALSRSSGVGKRILLRSPNQRSPMNRSSSPLIRIHTASGTRSAKIQWPENVLLFLEKVVAPNGSIAQLFLWGSPFWDAAALLHSTLSSTTALCT